MLSITTTATTPAARYRRPVRNRIAEDRGADPTTVPQEDIDKIFTLAHLEHQSGSEFHLTFKTYDRR